MQQHNMPPEVATAIANIPALQDFYAAERLKAETAAQDALNEQQRLLNEQQRLMQKQAELAEIQRRNDLEEQRNFELLRQGARIDQLFALTNGLIDAYISNHHNPMMSIMQAVQYQVSMILQAQGYIVPELAQRLGNDPRLKDLARQIAEEVRQTQMSPPIHSPASGKTAVIHFGDAPVNAPGAKINTMNIGD